ncbi:MAG: hypothetical protein LBQ01_05245 [Prevotellaceae bacterium]|jgi:hypothetical protein|nr:hypothetical protein [Prevotellaceae bacterium]
MKYVKIYLVILGLTGLFMSCAPAKYFVETEDVLSQIDWERNVLNYIPLMGDDLHSDVLYATYQLLKSKKYSQLNLYLSTVQNSPDYYPAKALYCIAKSKYTDALEYTDKIKENRILLKQLLSIDLNYELSRMAGEYNYKKFLQDYQNLTDEYPDNDILKKIIAVRIRYVRYNN